MKRFFPSWMRGGQHALLQIEAGDLLLRPPQMVDHAQWAELRAQSRGFLTPWEPIWPEDDLTRTSFRRRVACNAHDMTEDQACSLLIFRREKRLLLGGITLSNIRRRAAQSASLGYWMGEPYIGQGVMSRAVEAVCHHGFKRLALMRIEAACLPENLASMRVLEKTGFDREGLVRSYLSIAGRRRDHLLFARLSPHLMRSHAKSSDVTESAP